MHSIGQNQESVKQIPAPLTIAVCCPEIAAAVRLTLTPLGIVEHVTCSNYAPVAPHLCNERFDAMGFFRRCRFREVHELPAVEVAAGQRGVL